MKTTLGNSTHLTFSQEDSLSSLSNIFEPSRPSLTLLNRSSLNTFSHAHSTTVENMQEHEAKMHDDNDIEEQKNSSRQTLEINLNTHPDIEERVDERITDRIANHHELRLMKKPPEADKHFEHPTTVIAREGAYQWNEEIAQWTCRLNPENFHVNYQELSFLLQRATEITNPEGESAYSLLTLKQLNALDQALRIHHGDTIIGYTICEEIYLREINFLARFFCLKYSEYDYPPLPEAYSKRLLIFIQRPLVLDIAASLRVAAQSYLLFTYFIYTYFQYTSESQDDDIQFFNKNTPWFLLAICSMIAMSLLFLLSGCVNKKYILSAMIRLRWIEQSAIAVISNLLNYGPFLLSTIVIEDSFLPLIILGGVIGYYKQVKEVINIAQWTTLQFLLRSFLLSLTVGSFCALGFRGFIDDILFLYDDDFTSASYAEYLQALSIVRYCSFALMMWASLFRHPSASLTNQHWGRTAGQGMEGIGVALLDNYALYLLISDTIYMLNGSLYFSPKEPVVPTFFCGLQAISFIAVFLVTFPTTPNQPKYSLEKNPINLTWITKTLRFFNSIPERCLSHLSIKATSSQALSEDGIKTQTSILSKVSRPFGVNRFYPRAQSREVAAPIENPMSGHNTVF